MKEIYAQKVDGKTGWVHTGAYIGFQCDNGFSIKKGRDQAHCRTEGWDYQTLPVCQRKEPNTPYFSVLFIFYNLCVFNFFLSILLNYLN